MKNIDCWSSANQGQDLLLCNRDSHLEDADVIYLGRYTRVKHRNNDEYTVKGFCTVYPQWLFPLNKYETDLAHIPYLDGYFFCF